MDKRMPQAPAQGKAVFSELILPAPDLRQQGHLLEGVQGCFKARRSLDLVFFFGFTSVASSILQPPEKQPAAFEGLHFPPRALRSL